MITFQDYLNEEVVEEQFRFTSLSAFSKLRELITKETKNPVHMSIRSNPSGKSFKVSCYFDSFTSDLGFGTNITKYHELQLIDIYGPSVYLWPRRATDYHRTLDKYIKEKEKLGSRYQSSFWYSQPIILMISSIPEAVQRIVDAQDKAIEYILTGELQQKRKAYLRKKHGRLLHRDITAAMEDGLDKTDIIDIVNEVEVQNVLES